MVAVIGSNYVNEEAVKKSIDCISYFHIDLNQSISIMTTVSCTEFMDSQFGPIAKCDQFDFTLTFEQSILGIGISVLFLLWLPFKLQRLYGASIRTTTSAIHKAKIV